MEFENVIVFDSETTNGFDDPLMYDSGWAVVNLNSGAVLKTRSFVVKETFEDKELMANAYFVDKMPQYVEEIANGSRKLASLYWVRKTLAEDVKNYNVGAICAHNARFDYIACQTTQRYNTMSKYRWFFPYGIEIWDSLKMARQTFGKSKEYKDFCIDNGFMVNHKPRLTAEILYRYITKNLDFVESHTGLEDVLIEKDILLACLEMDNSIECKLWE